MKSPVEIHSSTTITINFAYRLRLKHLVWALVLLATLFSYGASGLQQLVLRLCSAVGHQ